MYESSPGNPKTRRMRNVGYNGEEAPERKFAAAPSSNPMFVLDDEHYGMAVKSMHIGFLILDKPTLD